MQLLPLFKLESFIVAGFLPATYPRKGGGMGKIAGLKLKIIVCFFVLVALLSGCSAQFMDKHFDKNVRPTRGPFTFKFALDLKVVSDPSGADVYVNEVNRGKTPLKLELRPSASIPAGSVDVNRKTVIRVFSEGGIERIKVAKEGYLDQEITFPKGSYRIIGQTDSLNVPDFLRFDLDKDSPIVESGTWTVKLRFCSTEPYRKAFEAQLDRGDYGKAEEIRMEWIDFIKSFAENSRTRSMRVELAKLEGVVGITDPFLVPLREKLLQKLREEDYETALKIQQLIINRENQLRPPPPPQTIVIRDSEGKDRIVNISPQEAKVPDQIVVEQKKRYGVTDVMGALNTLGVTAPLTKKDMAGFKLIDILLGR